MSEAGVDPQPLSWSQWLTEIRAPAVGVCQAKGYESTRWFFPKGLSVRYVRGSKMTDAGGMFQELQAALQFPYSTGTNWDGLNDWMRDLSWLDATTGFLLVVHDAERFLTHTDALEFIGDVCSWADEWANCDPPWWAHGPGDPPRDFSLTLPRPYRLLLQTEDFEAVAAKLACVELQWAVLRHPREERNQWSSAQA